MTAVQSAATLRIASVRKCLSAKAGLIRLYATDPYFLRLNEVSMRPPIIVGREHHVSWSYVRPSVSHPFVNAYSA